MLSIKNYLFYLWLFLLPFSWVIAYYTGFIALDKLIAPILIIIGMMTTLRATRLRVNRVIGFVVLAAVFLFVKNSSLINSGSTYWHLMWEDGIKIGYFLVPLLCIDNLEKFNRASWIVVAIAIVGCISALLVSLGAITLPVERFEITRLGEGGLRKAIGLFTSYGDMAQYVAFALLWVTIAPTINVANKNFYRVAKYVVYFSILCGLAGTQSRNVLLSVLLAIGSAWVFKRLDNKTRSSRQVMALGIMGALVFSFVLVMVFSGEIIGLLSSIGGGLASHTVDARLEQYALAWSMIKEFPLLGADSAAYAASVGFIEYIHNMWLRLAAHGGIVSVMVMIFLLSKVFIEIRKASYISEKSKAALIVSSYFIVMLFSVMFYVGMGQLYWALLGIAAALGCIEPFRKEDKVSESAVSESECAANSLPADNILRRKKIK